MSSNGFTFLSRSSLNDPLCDCKYRITRSSTLSDTVTLSTRQVFRDGIVSSFSSESRNSRVFSFQLTIGLCFSSQGSPNIIFQLPSVDTRNHSVMVLPFMSKVIRHFLSISPSILSVPWTFRTLIGLIGCCFHLWAILLSMNRPSAPQSIKACVFSVLCSVSTCTGTDILRSDIKCTVTFSISRVSVFETVSLGSSSTVMSPTVKNPLLLLRPILIHFVRLLTCLSLRP